MFNLPGNDTQVLNLIPPTNKVSLVYNFNYSFVVVKWMCLVPLLRAATSCKTPKVRSLDCIHKPSPKNSLVGPTLGSGLLCKVLVMLPLLCDQSFLLLVL